MEITKMANVYAIETEPMGGGDAIDFLYLHDGTQLAIGDGYIGCYKNRTDFYNAEPIWIQELQPTGQIDTLD